MTTPDADRLLAKIKAHDALVGIIGMGYVGLPLALAFVEKGFPVLGFDVDPEKVATLTRGEGAIKHLDGGRITAGSAMKADGPSWRSLRSPDRLLARLPVSLSARLVLSLSGACDGLGQGGEVP